jgi:hypothetical protein
MLLLLFGSPLTAQIVVCSWYFAVHGAEFSHIWILAAYRDLAVIVHYLFMFNVNCLA